MSCHSTIQSRTERFPHFFVARFVREKKNQKDHWIALIMMGKCHGHFSVCAICVVVELHQTINSQFTIAYNGRSRCNYLFIFDIWAHTNDNYNKDVGNCMWIRLLTTHTHIPFTGHSAQRHSIRTCNTSGIRNESKWNGNRKKWKKKTQKRRQLKTVVSRRRTRVSTLNVEACALRAKQTRTHNVETFHGT